MTKLLIATQNSHKINEYREMLAALGDDIQWLSLSDVGLSSMQVAETGTTFEDNATLKALAYGEKAGFITLADDSGLVVNALGGAPGVYSARYGAPEITTDRGRYEFLLRNLDSVTDRSAAFVCVIAIYAPSGDIHTVRGEVAGRITDSPRGAYGFGYDPVFELPDGRTAAELTPPDKHRISHRGRALQQALPLLQNLLK
jgi:XTP/dITP diphosphohydrolase